MAQDYTRQSTFADGDTITAALFNDEYNQLVNAFAYSSTSATTTGHRHDGTAGQGGNIPKIGDLDFLNKIEVDSTNNRWGFYVEVSSAAVEQIRIQDGAIVPVTDNDIDLGSSSLEFKDLYIDGTATIDTLTIDEAATIGTTLGVTGATTLSSTLGVTGATTLSSTLGVTGAATLSSTLAVTGTSTLTGNVTTTNDLSVGGNLTVTGNATISGNLTFGDADTDSITLTADVASHITPDTDDTYDLGSSTKEWRDIYIDGTAYLDAINFNGTAITATAAELNIMDGVTATATEINLLDGVTSTTAELNILDGVTATATELNILDGVTSTTAELNILDGVTSTTAELNILDGVTSTASELNLVDGSSAGTIVNSKAVVYGSAGEVNATTLQVGGVSITSTPAELNILDGVTATTAELNILDGVTATTAELNYVDGVTSNIQTQLDALQASDADLTAIAALSNTDGNFIVGNGTTWVAESGATARASLGLTIGTDVLAYDSNLQSFVTAFTVPTSDGTNGQALITNGSGTISFGDVDALPSQTGNSGYYLTTDGTSASWDNLKASPTFTGTVTISSTDALTLPVGTTAQRPTAAQGMIRYNTTTSGFEGYNGSAWGAIGAEYVYTRTSATATASQTTFSATYTVGYVDVYLNGVKLVNTTDFTATNGTSIVLTTGATVGDNVEIIAYETFSVANALTAANNLSDVDNAATAITNLGITSTAAELNILDGVTATATELNILDGVTATTTELNYLDITTLGSSEASKAVTADSNAKVKFIGTTSVAEMIEKVDIPTSTTGTINFDFLAQAVQLYNTNQTANRTINFRGDSSSSLNSIMSTGESMTAAVLMKQGTTAYYLNTYQIDGTAVTPEWSGGSAPSSGNASSIDAYVFTIIKTADATFTVLASQSQYA